MKKIISIIIMCLVIAPTFAFVMCAEDDTVVIPYGVGVPVNAYWPTSSNVSNNAWTVTSYYGNIMGVSACLPTSGTTYATNSSINAVGGEQAGNNCWCKMLHPVASLWGFYYSGGSLSDCLSRCANYCGDYVRSSAAFRSALFGSVAN